MEEDNNNVGFDENDDIILPNGSETEFQTGSIENRWPWRCIKDWKDESREGVWTVPSWVWGVLSTPRSNIP